MISSSLMVRAPWVVLLVSEIKTWKLRARGCHMRKMIAINQVRSKAIIGVIRIDGCLCPLTDSELEKEEQNHKVLSFLLQAHPKHRWVWTVADADRFLIPVPYQGKLGAQTFTTLDAFTAYHVNRQFSTETREKSKSHVFKIGKLVSSDIN